MTEERIHDVKRIMEIGLDTVHYQKWDVNEYLSEGWMLLKVLTDAVDSDNGPVQRPTFVLGWAGEENPPSDLAKAEAQESATKMIEQLRGMNIDKGD